MEIRKHLYRMSSVLQRAITPGLSYSQNIYESVLGSNIASTSQWLDVGCGHQLLSTWREDAERNLVKICPDVVGIDLDFNSLKNHRSFKNVVCANAAQLPFADETFSLVTANMVVEHLDDPQRQFAEVRRVLKIGGQFIFHTPNEKSYIIRAAKLLPDGLKRLLARVIEGRAEEDVFKTYYLANNITSITRLCDKIGFEIEELRFIRTSPVLNVVPPLLLLELIWIRALAAPRLKYHRTNIICILRKSV